MFVRWVCDGHGVKRMEPANVGCYQYTLAAFFRTTATPLWQGTIHPKIEKKCRKRSWDPFRHPHDMLQAGDECRVKSLSNKNEKSGGNGTEYHFCRRTRW